MNSPTRVVGGLTAAVESSTLRFLAARTPAWVGPDAMTVTGFVGAALTCLAYCLTNLNAGYLWLASLGLTINWLGDSLDGTLARFRRIERPRYGIFVDHTVDALSVVLILLGFGFSPYVKFEIACLMLIGYLLLTVLVFVRAAAGGVFQITVGRLGPTEARIVLILANTAIFFVGNPIVRLPFVTTTLIDLFSAFIAGWLFAAFGVSFVKHAKRFAETSD